MLRVCAFVFCICGLVANEASITLQVPYIKQSKEGCGSAAIAMVMEYWRDQLPSVHVPVPDVTTIQERLYKPEAKGIYGSDMEAFFRQAGFHAFRFKAEKRDLIQHLSRGRPVIVCLQPNAGAPLHYVVVLGFDPASDAFVFNDPARGKFMKEETTQLLKQWSGTENWALLAVPKGTN